MKGQWFTLEQLKRLGDPCCKCEKPAKWLPKDGNGQIWCDEHYPYNDIREEITERLKDMSL